MIWFPDLMKGLIYSTIHTKCIQPMFCIVCKLSDSTRENRAKARIGDIFDLDGPIMDGTHYPRYLQGQVGFGLWLPTFVAKKEG